MATDVMVKLGDVKIANVYKTCDMKKFDYDLDVAKAKIIRKFNAAKDNSYIGNIDVSVDYEQINDEDYLGNNRFWPIVISILTIDVKKAEKWAENIVATI